MSGLTGLSAESGLSVLAKHSLGPVAAWYTAAQVRTSGSAIDTLPDISGNQRDLVGTGSTRPRTGVRSLNGSPLITFDKDYLQAAQPIVIKACAFMVTRANGSKGDRRSTAIHGAEQPDSNATFIRANARSSTEYDISIDGYPSVNSGAASAWGGPLVAGANIDLGLDMRWQPGPLLLYAQYSFPVSVAYLGRYWVFLNNRYQDRRGRFDLSEIVFWSEIPSRSDRQVVEAELCQTAGLLDRLDLLHPYRRAAA